MIKKTAGILYVSCFLLFLLIPLALINTEEDIKSDFDNRSLIEWPEIDEAGFEDGVESYIQDRIGFRDEIVTGYQLLNDKIAGELTHPIYTYGQDGYMFFGMHNNIEYGTYHQTFAEAVVQMRDYCEDRGVPFYFMFDPEKISVYRRYLPKGVNYNDEWVEEFLSYLNDHGVNVVNNRDLLIRKSYEEQVFNRQYDAGHWNDLGCFYATNNLWKLVHKDFPAVTEYSLDDFDITTTVGQYLASSKFPVNEKVPVFNLKTTWEDVTGDYTGLKQNRSFPYFAYYVNNAEEAKSLPKMLVFHGSYYNRGPKFFVGRAREYIGIHDYQNVLNLAYYFNVFQPEMVVFEVAEYTVSDEYFNLNKMTNLNFNDTIDAIVNEEAARASLSSYKTTLNVIPNKGYDEVYLNCPAETNEAYLLSENNYFDLQDEGGSTLETGVPHGEINNRTILYFKDYDGNQAFQPVRIQTSQVFTRIPGNAVLSKGVSNKDNQYFFKTEVEDNHFNVIHLQLLDGSGNYIGLLDTIDKLGIHEGSFVHTLDSGWYWIRLKANSNRADEAVDVLAYLEGNKRYNYSFNVKRLQEKKIIISDFEIKGPCSYLLGKNELFNEVERTEGITGEEKLSMKTVVEDNAFNSMVLQLYGMERKEYLEPISVSYDTGNYSGRYYHSAPSGKYVIRLRGNSNLQDESIFAEIEMIEGMFYDWKYQINKFDPTEIEIEDWSFSSLGSIVDYE